MLLHGNRDVSKLFFYNLAFKTGNCFFHIYVNLCYVLTIFEN